MQMHCTLNSHLLKGCGPYGALGPHTLDADVSEEVDEDGKGDADWAPSY